MTPMRQHAESIIHVPLTGGYRTSDEELWTPLSASLWFRYVLLELL
jgi:hypothetical protein